MHKTFTVTVTDTAGNVTTYNSVSSWRTEGHFLSLKMESGAIEMLSDWTIKSVSIK